MRDSIARGDVPQALATTISAYGAEVYGFLRAVMRGQDSRLTYGRFIERLHLDLVSFSWDAELRVLVYAVARQEARRDRATRREVKHGGEVQVASEDLELLVLRLDRAFSWPQIARTFLGSPASEEDVLTEAARLRARFSEVRRELASRGEDHG